MTRDKAISILHPDTSAMALYEIGYYAGFREKQAIADATNEACLLACEALEEIEEREKGCELCGDKKSGVLHTEKYSGLCDIEVVVTDDVLEVNAYNHQTPYTEEIAFNFSINFCPKCGKRRKEKVWK